MPIPRPSSRACGAGSSPSRSVSGAAAGAVTFPSVTRTRSATVAVFLVLLALWVAPAAFAQEEPLPADRPPIVVEDEAAEAEAPAGGDAWTFRFLIPTVLAMAGLAIAATVVVYGVRVRGRYRVVR